MTSDAQFGGETDKPEDSTPGRDSLSLLFWQLLGIFVLYGALWPYQESISGARDLVLLMLATMLVYGLMTWVGFHFMEAEQ